MERTITEIGEKTNFQNNDDRLQQIKTMIENTNQTLVKLDKNLKFIKESKEMLKYLETKTSSANYIPLNHSRHREFVESVTTVVDFIRDWDQHAATREAQSYPRLKAALQQVETAITRNCQDFTELENRICELQSYYESVNHLPLKSDTTSSL